MFGQPAGACADDRGAEDRGREQDSNQRTNPGPGPGAVLGRLLGFGDANLAVLFLADHRGVEGSDRSERVKIEDGLVVGLGVGDLAVDRGVEEYGSVCHLDSFPGGGRGRVELAPNRLRLRRKDP